MKYKDDKSRKNVIKNYYVKVMFKRHKKKDGFTLIEIIAVIAIIGILATVILPNVNGYIKEAKKVKVVDQCRKVVMAVESYNLRYDSPIKENDIVNSAISNKGVGKYLDGVKLDNLNINSTNLKNCYEIVNGAEFDFLENTDILNPSTITLVSKDGKTK